MVNVLLYTTQPILVLGLAAALEEGDCYLATICSTLPLLRDALTRESYGVLLIEATPEVSVNVLSEIKDAAQGAPLVIWVDAVSTEFVAQAVDLGVRGVLRKNLALRLQVRCLEKVGSGEIWMEEALVASLLSARRIVLTAREQRLLKLLAQGLKNKEIAYRVGLTEGTVKVYFSRLFQKVGVTDRFELALYAIEHLFGGRCVSGEPEVPALPVASADPIHGAILTTGMARAIMDVRWPAGHNGHRLATRQPVGVQSRGGHLASD